MKILRVFALVLAIVLLVGACGGSDDGDDAAADATAEATAEPTEDAAAGSDQEFCDTVVAAEAAVQAAASGGDAGDVEGLLAQAEELAPEEIKGQTTLVIASVRQALESRDDSVFGSEEFSRNDEEVDRWVADNCGFEGVEVTAVDYAFEGVPETMAPGITTFDFTNAGEELHEMVIVRFKDDSLTIEDLMKLSDKAAQKKLEFLGASFGPPGTEDVEAKDLTAGKYAMVCFIPVGSTSEKAARKADGPPHVARGMSAEFTVE